MGFFVNAVVDDVLAVVEAVSLVVVVAVVEDFPTKLFICPSALWPLSLIAAPPLWRICTLRGCITLSSSAVSAIGIAPTATGPVTSASGSTDESIVLVVDSVLGVVSAAVTVEEDGISIRTVAVVVDSFSMKGRRNNSAVVAAFDVVRWWSRSVSEPRAILRAPPVAGTRASGSVPSPKQLPP